MNNSFEKYQKRRLRSSYLSVIVSIALVLFLVGLLGLIVLKTNSITKHFKEKVAITVFLKDNAKDSDVEILQAELQKKEYTKSITQLNATDPVSSIDMIEDNKIIAKQISELETKIDDIKAELTGLTKIMKDILEENRNILNKL